MSQNDSIHLPAYRHKVDLKTITDHPIKGVTVKYDGRDSFNNHWISMKTDQVQIQHLYNALKDEYAKKVQSCTQDPLMQSFGSETVRVRLARADNFAVFENEHGPDGNATSNPDGNPILWVRSSATCPTKEAEEQGLRTIFETAAQNGESFDAVVCFAGAFVSSEGSLASVVCRSVNKYKKQVQDAIEDDYEQPDTTDMPTDL